MERLAGWMQLVQRYGTKRTGEIVENLGKNRLWQRQLKNVLATTILGQSSLMRLELTIASLQRIQ